MNEHILHLLNKASRMQLGPLMHERGIPVPCYPDLRTMYSRPHYLRLLAGEMALRLERERIDVFAGCPVGGFPLAIALAMMMNRPFLCVRPRDSRRDRPQLEGSWRKGQRVGLVDDSLVLGKEKKHAIELLEEHKLHPVSLSVIMEVGGFPSWSPQRQWIKEKGIKVHALVTWHEWVHFLQREGVIAKETSDALLRLLENAPEWVKD
ncbi:hypothetical protein HY629_02500 [Candidatus Uhrbacteria bacterium]|nr:hypothetical protein [Candidatus Uhrbacteria bacterium]